MRYIKAYKGYGIPFGLVGLAVLGARTQNLYVLYGLILATCIVVALVAYKKVDERFYPIILFAIGLSLLWQTTLLSNGLVGSDIHTEYYFYSLARNNGWDASLPYDYNATIGAVLIAPFLSKLFHIDGVWIFKVVYPLLFAFAAPLLYQIYKKQFGALIAFLGVFFLVIVPTWSLELVGLPRQMLGELMLVLIAWTITATSWRIWVKAVLIGAFAILGVMFHYVMGPIILLYLGISTVALMFFKARRFPVKWLVIVTVIIAAASFGWYGGVASGAPLSDIRTVAYSQLTTISPKLFPKPIIATEPATPPALPTTLPPAWTQVENKNLLERQEPLIRTAFGLDFGSSSPLGKAFRILQFATQFLMVIGCVVLFVKRKKYSPEYLSWAVAGVVMIGAVLVIPRFANMINATRFYHLVLLILAPALILGGQLVFRNIKLLTVGLLIPYFLFTSGAVFELSQSNSASSIDIPYSIALSHERVDVAAVFTDNDIAVRDWAVDNQVEPLFLDINGMLLFSERLSPATWRHIRENAIEFTDGWSYLRETADKLPDKAYIFLREWNTQHLLLTFKPQWYNLQDTTSGRRQSYPISSLGLGELLTRDREIFRSGDAVLYEIIR